MRRVPLLCVTAGLALLPTLLASSEPDNARLPAWLKFGGEERVRFESLANSAFKPGSNSYLLQRLRLDLTITPRPWLKFVAQAQDSRVFSTNVRPLPASQHDPVDLRIAYVQVGGINEGRAGFRLGRQSLDFAEGRLLADPNWSNVGRTFDAARLTLRGSRVQLHLFSGLVDRIVTDGFDEPVPGERLHGAFVSVDRAGPAISVFQPYLFWRLATQVKAERSPPGSLSEGTLGARWATKYANGFQHDLEAALQRGTSGKEPVSAWAGHFGVSQTVSAPPRNHRIYAEFNYGSGDADPRDGRRGGFDVIFPSTHDKFGLSDVFCWTNLIHTRAGHEFRVSKPLLMGAAFNSYWLADTHDGLYTSGKLVVAGDGGGGRHAGNAVDFQASWKITRSSQIQAAASRVFAGEFLNRANRTSFSTVAIAFVQRLL